MKQSIYKTLGILILLGSLAIGWLWMDFKGFMNSRAELPEAGIDIEIVEGDTLVSVTQRLYQLGIIRSTFYPRLAGKIYPRLTRLKRGEYHLDSHFSHYDMFVKFTSGKVKTYQIRFIEGWTFNEYLSVLQSEPKLRQDLANFKNQQILDALKLEQAHPEGWFYPDTYNYQKGTSDLEILQSSHQLMNEKLERYWNERDIGLPYETAYDVLIMASLIEKETGLSGERDRIAGVFVRRLNMNMRLQTDPTVIYGMGDTFDGNLRRRDLRADTPYNTYTRKGLPPTPIAMPGVDALHAVMHPAKGKSLYFVAMGEGKHYFSNTLKQHNLAVDKFQRKKKGIKLPPSGQSE